MQTAPLWVPIAIAVGSVIVVPAAVWIGRKIAAAWHQHRVRVLGEIFLTRAEFQSQFESLGDTQARQHSENKALLEALRVDGRERETKLTTLLDTARKDHRDEQRELRDNIGEVHKRVDSVLTMLGNRRKT